MSDVSSYLATIGRRGGQKSRRTLTTEQSKAMLRVREARRAFRTFHARCFWSERPDYQVTSSDIDWVVERLRTYGGHEGLEVAERLCR